MASTEETQSNSSATSSPYEPTNKKFSSTSDYLEWLSIAVMEAHTTSHGFDPILFQHVASDFEMVNASVHECPLPPAANLAEHLQQIVQFRKDNPGWKVNATNVSVSLLKGSNSAEVWLTMRGCDADDITFNRESVSILHWRRRSNDGVWVCYRHTGIRGPGDSLAATGV
ncbi:hypothetical protein CKM354_001208400 [Cercospora kikuchii]|uniref:SnoaL-like domain-containing protein n=1 Tax=Cercospora kikuchii TaxID=84275 RepID=A0A9P3CQQ8_9PEZI|nr:uncharacterized protein CKM354_001208400 [Cercospora kikuchii]GIZ49044.1 hypothetical protein CKM354_001208400 [Cercospora kikuchii]